MNPEPTYPHFLCIGAQKSGTTWLFQNLRAHPGVCLDHIKEVNYFNTRGLRFWELPRNFVWKKVFKTLVSDLFRQSWAQTCWQFRYLFFRRTDAWYASLFRSCGEKLIGDITPAYANLGAKEVEHVASMMPSVKIILLLRNPMERAWSHARMDLLMGFRPFSGVKKTTIDNVSFDLLCQQFNCLFSELQGDYLRTLSNWGLHFPTSQIFVGFLEEIESFPVQFLNRVCAFLGIEAAPEQDWPKAGERFNVQSKKPMPPEVARYLSQKYILKLKELELSPLLANKEFVTAWRKDAERHLDHRCDH